MSILENDLVYFMMRFMVIFDKFSRENHHKLLYDWSIISHASLIVISRKS